MLPRIYVVDIECGDEVSGSNSGVANVNGEGDGDVPYRFVVPPSGVDEIRLSTCVDAGNPDFDARLWLYSDEG